MKLHDVLRQGGGRRNGARRAGQLGPAGAGAAKATARSTAAPMSRPMPREMESVLLARLQADEIPDPLVRRRWRSPRTWRR